MDDNGWELAFVFLACAFSLYFVYVASSFIESW